MFGNSDTLISSLLLSVLPFFLLLPLSLLSPLLLLLMEV